jgi:hypothetical protein
MAGCVSGWLIAATSTPSINSISCLGTGIGIAAMGALFQNRLAATFANSAAGRRLNPATAHAVGQNAAAGNVDQAAAAPGQQQAVLEAVRHAFVHSFNTAMWF